MTILACTASAVVPVMAVSLVVFAITSELGADGDSSYTCTVEREAEDGAAWFIVRHKTRADDVRRVWFDGGEMWDDMGEEVRGGVVKQRNGARAWTDNTERTYRVVYVEFCRWKRRKKLGVSHDE